ncbi:MAG TPA: site-specific DNA-methyltransferase [Verrucomicrobiae bacterium]|nr:site-specific DNA-methyltransferase [Verrucomicrobiae bacterium]
MKTRLQIDQIRCGDCREQLKRLPRESVHLAITSRPYNVGLACDGRDDRMSYDKDLAWTLPVWCELYRILVEGGRFALNIAPTRIKDFRPIHYDMARQLRQLGLIMRTEIIWNKQTMRRRTAWGSWKSPRNPHIIPRWEYVLIFSRGTWTLEGNKGHPAPFPEELIYRLIKFYSYRGNVVLDPFGGTGTVAVVAKKTGRHFIHIDLSRKFCQIAAKRLAKRPV